MAAASPRLRGFAAASPRGGGFAAAIAAIAARILRIFSSAMEASSRVSSTESTKSHESSTESTNKTQVAKTISMDDPFGDEDGDGDADDPYFDLPDANVHFTSGGPPPEDNIHGRKKHRADACELTADACELPLAAVEDMSWEPKRLRLNNKGPFCGSWCLWPRSIPPCREQIDVNEWCHTTCDMARLAVEEAKKKARLDVQWKSALEEQSKLEQKEAEA